MLDYNFLKNPYPDNPDPVSGEYAPQSLQEFKIQQIADMNEEQQKNILKQFEKIMK